MLELTREQYERRLLEGESLPTEFIRIEADGTKSHVFLTSGAAAAVENPRLKNPEIRQAVTMLADLLEFYHVDRDERPVDTPLSDFLESKDAYTIAHASVLEKMVREGTTRLGKWINNRKCDDKEDLVDDANLACFVLRCEGF
jgi:hypothetical protein